MSGMKFIKFVNIMLLTGVLPVVGLVMLNVFGVFYLFGNPDTIPWYGLIILFGAMYLEFIFLVFLDTKTKWFRKYMDWIMGVGFDD